MKTIQKISICFILSLLAIAWVGKDCCPLFDHTDYVIENTANGSIPEKSISFDTHLSEADVSLTQNNFSFNLKYLSSEKVTVADFKISQNNFFRIWQPPKVS